jgi:hypothetical protein
MNLRPLFALLGIVSIIAPSAIHAQSVTWGATGLPPGMSIVPVNGTTAKITGTPTTAGIYNPTIFPKIGNVLGDMSTFRLTVLPNGLDLPIYYAYERNAPNGDSLQALAGGNGSVLLVSRESKKLYFTTNGINFTEATFKSEIPNGYVDHAEFAGSRCLVKFENPSSIYYSDNKSVFKPLDFPIDLTDPDYTPFVSNRLNRFFLLRNSQIWSMKNNQTTWEDVNLPIEGSFYGASMAANGNLLILACSYNEDSVGLCYSTNSGETWIKAPNNPGILRVAYGNGMFLGSGSSGVYKSTNGIDWQKISSLSNVGSLMFSVPENLFFSNFGVSKDGLYWVDYDNGSNSQLVSSGTGLIFAYDKQLSITKVPHLYGISSRKASVNKPASFQIEVSQ